MMALPLPALMLSLPFVLTGDGCADDGRELARDPGREPEFIDPLPLAIMLAKDIFLKIVKNSWIVLMVFTGSALTKVSP